MPFKLNSKIDRFDSQTTVSGTTAAVLSGAYSITGDIVLFNHTTETPYASIVFQATFLVAPSAGESITLYARPANLPPTGQNSPVPAANFDHYKVAQIPVDASTSLQTSSVIIKLDQHELNTQFRFYIKNESGQTIPAGWSIKLIPRATGPQPLATITADTQIVGFQSFTEATSGGGTALVLDAGFSVTGDMVTLTNTNDASEFSITFRCTYSVAPDTNSDVRLYCRLRNVNGSQNEPAPGGTAGSNYRNSLVGILPVVDITGVQLITIPIRRDFTLSQQDHEYFIENRSGQTIPATWQMWETPITTRPQ